MPGQIPHLPRVDDYVLVRQLTITRAASKDLRVLKLRAPYVHRHLPLVEGGDVEHRDRRPAGVPGAAEYLRVVLRPGGSG